mmetsp:Transcript_12993/g.15858  ORF Transcript_12993/g.15858 Transcript_12993/m.15858 type:complete len:90 (-) Transcript_12993:1749-2018(-)
MLGTSQRHLFAERGEGPDLPPVGADTRHINTNNAHITLQRTLTKEDLARGGSATSARLRYQHGGMRRPPCGTRRTQIRQRIGREADPGL